MLKMFSSYTNTVRSLIKGYDAQLFELFHEPNLEEELIQTEGWMTPDNYLDFYSITVKVPVKYYQDLKKRGILEETESVILGFYRDAMRGINNSPVLQSVYLRPTTDDVAEFGDIIDELMWRPGLFRLFISHLSQNKLSASHLKQYLSNYGIDCFVAHEDITPSKEWEEEIEKALFTMDALCAIVEPEFIKSQWCDQEVGIALGQKKLVISRDKGCVPYGFFGKYQALKGTGKMVSDVAFAVWKAISTNDKTKTKYINYLISLILNSSNAKDAIKYINILAQCQDVDKGFIESLHGNFKSNEVLNSEKVLKEVNPIFITHELMPLSVTQETPVQSESMDLPF